MSDKLMIITEAIVLLLSIGAVLSGATHHLFFAIGFAILFGIHIKQYQYLKSKENGKNARKKGNNQW
jgi:hypothetical protein